MRSGVRNLWLYLVVTEFYWKFSLRLIILKFLQILTNKWGKALDQLLSIKCLVATHVKLTNHHYQNKKQK